MAGMRPCSTPCPPGKRICSPPQTSGGLLIAASPECVGAVLETLGDSGAVIGYLETGVAEIRVD